MTYTGWDDVTAELNALLEQIGDDLPPDDRTNVIELVEAGEFGVAFETLTTQLYEYDIPVRRDTLARLGTLGERLKLDPSLWEILDG